MNLEDHTERPSYGEGDQIPDEYFGDDLGAGKTLREIRLKDSGLDPDPAQRDSAPARLRAFATFLSSHAHILQSIPHELIPLARNHAADGFVVEQAAAWAEQLERPWIARDPRPSAASVRPSRFRTLQVGGRRVAISGDGSIAVSAGSKTLYVWNVSSGKLIYTLDSGMNLISAIALTPDGSIALSGEGYTDRFAGGGASIRVWDLRTGEHLRTLAGHTDAVRGIAVSADGSTALSSGEDHTIRFWDVTAGVCLRKIDCKGKGVALTADGRVALCSADKTVIVWDVNTGNYAGVLGGYAGEVVDVSVSADCRIALAADGNTIRYWDVAAAICLRETRIPSGEIERVSLTPDGRMALTIDGGFRLFSGNRSWTIPNRLHVWDVASGECVRTLASGVADAALTANGRVAISAGGDLDLWDVVAGDKELAAEKQNQDEASANDIIASPDERFLLIPSYNDLRLSEVGSGETRYLSGHSDNIASAAWSPDGSVVLSGAFDHTVRVWDAGTGACLRARPGGYGSALAISADGRVVASGSSEVEIWDSSSGELLRTLPAPPDAGNLIAIAFTPDDQTLVTANSDPVARVWSVDANRAGGSQDDEEIDRTEPLELSGHTGLILGTALTSDGRSLITASEDGTLRVWDLGSGACAHTLAGQGGPVRRVIVSPDGRTALSASQDRTIQIWDIESGSCIGMYYAGRNVLAISRIRPDGRFTCVAAGDDFHELTLRCVRQGRPIVTAVRLFRFSLDDLNSLRDLEASDEPTSSALLRDGQRTPGAFDSEITSRCPYCGRRFSVPMTVVDAIRSILESANLGRSGSPCRELPADAWRESRLQSDCPICDSPLRFNPFIVDNRDRY